MSKVVAFLAHLTHGRHLAIDAINNETCDIDHRPDGKTGIL